ncbi:MAG: tRNA lysidine(34) synthetase TilS [Chloroflexi bacterium]|nr:tRNA lysidine(34) synthetase TilS [Chloroflexota bacterium]
MPSTEASRLTARLHRRIADFLRARKLAPSRSVLLVGISGGPDSVALLHALASLRPSLSFRLHAAHLNHRLRGNESEADAGYVRDLCRALDIPLTIESAEVEAYRRRARLSLEEAGRHIRYGFFATVAKKVGAQAVLLGHTADDQAETVLMHLLRGSGLGGLRGMEAVSAWRGASGATLVVARPLLTTRRRETHDYCTAHRLAPRRDSSNRSLKFFRNRVRLELLPALRSYNPRIEDALLRMAEGASHADDYLKEQVAALWKSLATLSKEGISLEKDAFAKLPLALQTVALQRALAHLRGNLEGIEWEHLAAMREIAAGPAGRSTSLPGGLRFEAGYRELTLRREAPPQAPPPSETPLAVPGAAAFGEWSFTAKLTAMPKSPRPSPNVLWLDAAWAERRLTLRVRRPGDRFTPSGMRAPKKLQDFMVDAKLPRSLRDRLPLLCADGAILWLVGLRASALASRPKAGQRALRVTLLVGLH